MEEFSRYERRAKKKKLMLTRKTINVSDVETRSAMTLARMELNGVGFCDAECDRQRRILQV